MKLSMKNIRKYMYKDFYEGKFQGDYKSVLEKEVTKILKITKYNGDPPTIRERKYIIEALFEAYIEQTKEQPDGVQVQRLGNWLLLEELTNNHPDKVTRKEYPFLTKRQLRTRYRREMANENIPETLTEQRYLGGTKSPTYKKHEQ